MKGRVFLLACLIILTFSPNPAFAQSFQQVKGLAERGDPVAQCRLGFMYAEGKGVKQDYALAKWWYEKAAAQGDARSQYCLGIVYQEGLGVKQDFAQAKSWYEKAAAQGHAKAKEALQGLKL